ncbi:MAG: hypothetical protein K0B10_01645 [Vicingaceae bacterium]|nr:hypothetical protein [Vicingaceae bacterium]
MRKLIAKDLKIKFTETLNELDEFSYEDGNPFLIKIGKKQYFVFLKNLSPAYFKNSPDVTRVQLPYSNHFSKIFKADIPFIILGYDVDNDTVVSWNPKKIKERLNAKNNVSLYSRSSLQEQVKDHEFKFGYLSNGEKIVLFKRDNLTNFFNQIKDLFKERQEKDTTTSVKIAIEPTIEYSSNKLLEITDKALLQDLKPLLRKNQVLQAVEITSNYFDGKFKDMTFKDWYQLVNQLYKKMNSKE